MAVQKNKKLKALKGQSIPDVRVSSFGGLNTSIQNTRDLPSGTAVSSMNWITGTSQNSEGKVYGDHIELRRGFALLGQTRQTGNGHISGMGVGILESGVEVPFYTFNNFLYYYNAAINDTANTTLVLPVQSINDDFAVNNYNNLAGAMIYVSSKNSGVFKIPVANPTSPITLSVPIQGYFKIDQNRTFMWNTFSPSANVKDTTDVAISYVDKTQVSQYNQGATKTQGTGDGTTKTFSNTVAMVGGNTIFGLTVAGVIATPVSITGITLGSPTTITAPAHGLTQGQEITLYGIVGTTQLNNVITVVGSVVDANTITVPIDSTSYTPYSSGGDVGLVELFSDNYDGTMTSNLGGSGTVNYATGAYSVTFTTAPVNGTPIDLQYYREDSTSQGIFDFTFSAPRTNGQGSIFTQFNGSGALMAVWPIADVEYCFHFLSVFQLQLTSDDTQANNLLYRQNIGVPYWRSAWPTGEGIIYLDIFNNVNPRINVLELTAATTNVNPAIEPNPISLALDLSQYDFSGCVIFEFGDY